MKIVSKQVEQTACTAALADFLHPSVAIATYYCSVSNRRSHNRDILVSGPERKNGRINRFNALQIQLVQTDSEVYLVFFRQSAFQLPTGA
jgi:hypothetical protein